MSEAAIPDPRRMTGRMLAAILLIGGLALVPLVASATNDPYLTVIATRIAAWAIAAMALDLILGYGAMVSFGQAAYLGFGAYAVAILTSYGITDLILHIAAAVIVSAVFATITGAISLRTRGVYFIMITLAFGQMAFFFFVSLSAWGGDDGTTLPTRSTLLGSDALQNDILLFYLTLVILAGLFALTNAVVNARFGRVLLGIRENPTRMEAIGFQPFRFRLAAFVLAACITSVAGVLLANQSAFVSPALMSWHRSGDLIVMVVLGGLGTLSGAIGGAVIFILLQEWLDVFTEHWQLLLGVILVLVALYSPSGVTGLIERLRGRA